MPRTRKVTISTDAAGHTTGWATTGLAAATPVAPDHRAAATPVAPDHRAAAFFDVDNTMLRGASIYWLARGLAARNYFTTADLAQFAWRQARFRLLAAEHAGDMSHAREAALAFVAGWRVSDVERLTEEIFDELMASRIWPGSRALAQLHLGAGQRVWLVSATPVEVGRVIAQRLGLTGALGTVAEVVDGAYTGRLAGELMHGPAKAEAIVQLAAVEGLELARCSAYSDSANDLPMLTAVGHPVAVNPDTALRRQARDRGWQVRDFRTGRKAARIAVPSTVAAGFLAGAVTAGLAIRRRRATG
ncbi:HAD superfamily hydrolase (TIGR01490 family) [Micromonospora sp. Llam0]|uniref:HAD family hydrolase n=1 Tax=Micromonospora sp. Llam0 TaxID=2485143 RepID=UPI000F4731D0|nr:HAD-IB family hydrolase [Micromonospora sp. Llam0]ROO51360.1 HAD superfamily hydrolase (TIGR01490 family) [Micromonospora sp. Llam0]